MSSQTRAWAQQAREEAAEIRALAEPFAWVEDVHTGMHWHTLTGIIRVPEGITDDTPAREARRLTLEKAEALLEALAAAGWQFTDGIELGFRTEIEHAYRAVDGTVVIPAKQSCTTLSIEVLIETGRGEPKAG